MGDLIQYTQNGYRKANNGYCYILVLIDVFTKMIYCRPLKKKDQFQTATAFDSIFQEFQEFPNSLITDDGLEFFNTTVQKVLKQYNIHHYSTHSKLKAMVAERAIRTLKSRFEKYFTENQTKKWIDVLDQFVDNYNNTPHRTIGMAPSDVNESNRKKVFAKMYPDKDLIVSPRLKIGDKVRIIRDKSIFEKGYTKNWSDKVYEIIGRYQTNGVVWYRLKDSNNITLHQKKYYWELNLVSKHVPNSSNK